MKIDAIKTRWVLDSLGNPTVEVDVILSNGSYGRASVPTGLSLSSNEASQLRDDYPMFGGHGVSKALNIVEHTIAPVLIGSHADNQEAIDAKIIALDDSKNKNKIGANTALAVSIAVAKASAQAQKKPFYTYIAELAGNKTCRLPKPVFTMLGGGLHAQKTIDIESVVVLTKKAKDIHTSIRVVVEILQSLRQILSQREYALVRASDGSFAPVGVKSNNQAFELVLKAIKSVGYIAGEDVNLGVDFAASQYYEKGHYNLKCDHLQLGSKAYKSWLDKFIDDKPISYIEDPFEQESWSEWSRFAKDYQNRFELVADELVSTNDKRLRMAIKQRAATAIMIKPIQIGTLSETIHTHKHAKRAGLKTVAAARAGETEDNYLAHLGVGLNCDYIKSGAPASGERVAKYNELLRISESLQTDLF